MKDLFIQNGTRLWHGTTQPDFLDGPMPPAAECSWFNRVRWDQHDDWMNGGEHLEAGIPYANIIWEALGLREKGRPSAPEWARGIRTFRELGETIGMLFVTPDPDYAKSWYGETFEIDVAAEQILGIIDDPHIRYRDAFILLIKAGEPFPILKPPAPTP